MSTKSWPAMATGGSQPAVAKMLDALSSEQRKKWIASLTDDEAEAILHDWAFWARPNQLLPPGDWDTWLVMAGRGFGKTRTGAETVREWIKDNPIVNIIAPTMGDIHKVVLDGPAGIMAVCPPGEQPKFKSRGGENTLMWPNGAKSLLFSAESPERQRGPQCYKLWGDEIAAWRFLEETLDQAMFGLRLGKNPQALFTTTPKPVRVIKAMRANPGTKLTTGTTYDNRDNLAPKFYAKIISKYEGTRLGRQELNAELLEDNPGALWSLKGIDADRVREMPANLTRVVIGVDPAVSNTDESDLTGIVVCAEGPSLQGEIWPPHYYVIDDLSLQASPDRWASTVVKAYGAHGADRIVAETNNGGDLVEALLRAKSLEFAYTAVHASRGKLTRAEPIAALYEQHRVHHVGSFPQLEDQMCDYVPLVPGGKPQKSPDRMDALVWALWELNNPEEIEIFEDYDEPVSITPELDAIDDLPYFWRM
jgi:phage terminase large subunit-like protein